MASSLVSTILCLCVCFFLGQLIRSDERMEGNIALLVAPVAVWMITAEIDVVARSTSVFPPSLRRAAMRVLRRLNALLPTFACHTPTRGAPRSGRATASLLGRCLLSLCRHRSTSQTLDTASRFISTCWRDVNVSQKDILMDYTAGMIGGVWSCFTLMSRMACQHGGPPSSSWLDALTRWWPAVAGRSSGARLVSFTWIGGSPFVMAVGGFRLVYRSDLQVLISIALPMLRRGLHLYNILKRNNGSLSGLSAKDMGWDALERECHDWIEILAFGAGAVLGGVTWVAGLTWLGYRVRRARGVPAFLLDRQHLATHLPAHPVRCSAALQQAFDGGTAPKEFICPLTHQLFEQPVVAADGHTYEAEFIDAWLARHSTSPACGAAIAHSETVPNYTLRSLMESWGREA